MKLKDFAVGQKWNTRRSGIVTITSLDGSPDYPVIASWEHGADACFTPSGQYLTSSPDNDYDLVELIEVPGQSAIVKELIEQAERYEAQAKREADSADAYREHIARHEKAAEEYRAMAAEYRRVAAVA